MAYYNLKKKPALTTKEGETETMYADVVYNGTITAERLIHMVAKRTGFKEGVIDGILTELKDDVLQYLGEGYRVELGEFGFFSAKVKASRLVADKNDIRSSSVAFNGVNFRASKSFREGIRGDLERKKCIDFRASREWDKETLKKIVLQYIRQHGFITRSTYTQLTGRLKNTALADLKSFVSEGVIKREGWGNQTHFIAANHIPANSSICE
ncbi:HU family DNA-binding protein [Bacteroides congonensis]|uniref:HU family DNA-binding protein n=1 Tax=Bacteroides congonensis TaxID=1871006 RepID=UPI00267684A7|nr:HU family DNA-binding protein [Bacteroides congonensis]